MRFRCYPNTICFVLAVIPYYPDAHAELAEILRKTIQGLPQGFRVVFVLRDVEGLSTEETAETLGLSVPAVKSRLLRARS